MILYRCDGEYVYPCDAGSYQYQRGQSGCKVCPNGTYDTRNSTSEPSYTCDECEEGYVCLEGHRRPCRLGTYSYNSAHECFPCYGDPEDPNPCIQGEPPVIRGKLCDISEYVDEGRVLWIYYSHLTANDSFVRGTPSKDECKICPSGFSCKENFQNGTFTLHPCSDDEHSPDGHFDCHYCPIDSGLLRTDEGCVDCPFGHQCLDGYNIIACDPGSYSPGFGFCIPCPHSYYCPDPSGWPVKCQPGFTTELGAANKTQCFLIPYDVGINDEGEPFECGRDEFSPPGSDKEGFHS